MNLKNTKVYSLDEIMNLKNTKVYSLDEDVICKYAALCGKELVIDHDIYGGIGYDSTGSSINCFWENGDIDSGKLSDGTEIHLITPDQINALYTERFGQVETPEEKEAFEVMTKATSHVSDTEWKNGDECVYYYIEGKEWRDGIYVTNDDGFHVVRDFHDNGYTGVTDKRLRKQETEAERKERERLEAAYDLYCTQCKSQGVDPLNLDTFTDCGLTKPWLAIVDKTGYKKEK